MMRVSSAGRQPRLSDLAPSSRGVLPPVSDWGRWGLSAFYARSAAEVEDLSTCRQHLFSQHVRNSSVMETNKVGTVHRGLFTWDELALVRHADMGDDPFIGRIGLSHSNFAKTGHSFQRAHHGLMRDNLQGNGGREAGAAADSAIFQAGSRRIDTPASQPGTGGIDEDP